MGVTSIAAMTQLAAQSTADEQTKKLLSDMVELIGNLVSELKRQQEEITSLQRFAVENNRTDTSLLF